MAIIYPEGTKESRMTATRDDYVSGTLEILDGVTVLASFALTAGGGTVTSAGGNTDWTLAVTSSSVTASATGTADGARINNSGATLSITGLTVGTTGSDINLDDVSIVSGGTVTLTSAVIRHYNP